MDKTLILILALFSFSAHASIGPQAIISKKAGGAGICGAYVHYRVITIPAQSGLSADLSNYPVEVQGTYSYLATVANGGLAQNANGYDIGFFTDNTCATKLAWETEIYTAASGVVTYWVKLPTVSKTTSNTFVMAYDSPTVTTDQSDPTNVYDANFKLVYHLPNGTTLTANDSTSNANTGTLGNRAGFIPIAATGLIDGAGFFNGNNGGGGGGSWSFISTAAPVTTATSSVTMSAWIYTTNNAQDGQCFLANGSDNSGNGYTFCVNKESVATGHLQFLYSGIAWWDTGSTVTSNAWHYAVATIGATGLVTTVYLDGTSVGSHTFGSAPVTPTLHSYVGFDDYITGHPGTDRAFLGNIDEVRMSNSVRSADWIATDYASQSSPATFYSVGSQF